MDAFDNLPIKDCKQTKIHKFMLIITIQIQSPKYKEEQSNQFQSQRTNKYV